LLGIINHRCTYAALDGIGGIAPLDFGQNNRRGAIGYAIQAYQWRIADGLRVICEPVWHAAASFDVVYGIRYREDFMMTV